MARLDCIRVQMKGGNLLFEFMGMSLSQIENWAVIVPQIAEKYVRVPFPW